jgi:hypothetical protein
MLHKDYYRKGSVEKKSLVVNLKGLDAKTNWLAVNWKSKNNFDIDMHTWPHLRCSRFAENTKL